MPKLNLDRQTLSKFLPNHQAIVAFERVFEDVGTTLPTTIEEANANAGIAIAAAQSALAALVDIIGALEQLLSVPASADPLDPDDTAPRLQVGTLATQNNDAVDITGGRIGLDAGTVGAPSFYLNGEDTTGLYRIGANSWSMSIAGIKLMDFSDKLIALVGRIRIDVGTVAAPAVYFGTDTATGLYSIGAGNWGFSITGAKLLDFSNLLLGVSGSVSVMQQLVSTIAVGTPPLVVTSTTLVPNLYVARAANADAAATLSSPTTFPAAATDLPTVITLANALRAAAIAKGL